MTQVSHDRSNLDASSVFVKSNWAERWQSLKAGILGAIVTSLIFTLLTAIHHRLLLADVEQVLTLPTWHHAPQWIVSCAIAALSGFLFAVTYRYVVRQDQNPHLKSGAVGAFSLVRGLAQAETSWHEQASFVILTAIVLESFFLFGVVRILLDMALQHRWIKPFSTSQESSGCPVNLP